MANPNRLNPSDRLSQKNLLIIGAFATTALLGLASCAPSAKDVARELATIQAQAAAATGTPIPPYLNTLTPTPPLRETPTVEATFTRVPTVKPTATEVPQSCSLYEYYAGDIIAANPTLSTTEVTNQLEAIAGKIPTNAPFQAKSCYGLIPHPSTGGVVQDGGAISRNAPEGGYHYGSFGHGTYTFNSKRYEFPWKKNNVYLSFVVGKPDDYTPADLNTTVKVTDYKAGHIYVNQATPAQGQEFPQRRIIDRAWFAQQLWWAAQSGSNCGVGCEYTITVDFIDAQTGKEYIYQVNPKTFEWKQINRDQLKSQVRQEEVDQLARLSGRNPGRITRPLNPRAYRNPFKGIRI